MTCRLARRATIILAVPLLAATLCCGQDLTIAPDRSDGIYQIGETVRWTIQWRGSGSAPDAQYVLKSGGLKEVGQGEMKFKENVATIETTFDAPGTSLVEIDWELKGQKHRAFGGAVAAPDKIEPAAGLSDDFDAFWKSKLAESRAIPLNPKLEPADAKKPGVSYWKIIVDNIWDSHIHGQLARPEKGDRFPALLIPQWAGVYPLQKPWVTDRAAEGWLALNLIAHDLPIDNPEEFYKQQSDGPLKNYWMIGNEDRDKSYYLRMYLSCVRAVEYLKSRPDWDGKTIVVMGSSQGGQQALVTAGLCPDDITAVIAFLPAACDMLAPEIGRASGFPNWYAQTWGGRDAAKVHETSKYFDPVNFARKIKCPALIACALLDDLAPPSSVLAAANQIKSPKEVMILPRAGHQDERGSQQPMYDRGYRDWLPALRDGKPPPIKQGIRAVVAGQQDGAKQTIGSSLKDAAAGRFFVGAAISASDLDNPELAKLIVEQFDCITAGNEFKPDSLQHERGKFTFDSADKIASFAKQDGMKLIGHNLLWHNQAPGWLFMNPDKQPLPREEALANLKAHIDGVVEHFHNDVLGWDVVNEALSDADNEYLRDTPAHQAIGDDFVTQAFKLAHEANPNVELYYNDYNIEMPGKRDKAIRLIRELKSAGCRVDAVGIQGHWLLEHPDVKVIDEAIGEFARLGVKVMITELDVDVLPRKGAGADISATEKQGMDPYKAGLPEEVQQKLAQRYADLFRVFAKHRGDLTRVTFWGVYDGNTWLNDWPVKGRTNHPMLWDRQLQPKPALRAVIDALTEAR